MEPFEDVVRTSRFQIFCWLGATLDKKKKIHRRKLFVDPAVQSVFIRRIFLQCGCFVALSFFLTFITPFLVENTSTPWSELPSAFSARISQLPEILVQFGVAHGILLVVGTILIPVFCLDMLEVSHRFSGPMIRMRRAIKDLIEGREMEPIQLRDADSWTDIAGDINILAQKVQALEQIATKELSAAEIRENLNRTVCLQKIREESEPLDLTGEGRDTRATIMKVIMGLCLGTAAGISTVYLLHSRPQNQVEDLRIANSQLQTELTGAQETQTRSDDSGIAESAREITTANQQLVTLNGQIDERQEHLHVVESNLQKIKEDRANVESQLTSHHEQLALLNDQLSQKRSSITELESAIVLKQNKLIPAQNDDAVPEGSSDSTIVESALNDPLQAARADFDKLTVQLSQANDDLIAASTQLESKEQALARIQMELYEAEKSQSKFDDQLQERTRRFDQLQEEYGIARGNLSKLRSQIEEKQDQLSQIEHSLSSSRSQQSSEQSVEVHVVDLSDQTRALKDMTYELDERRNELAEIKRAIVKSQDAHVWYRTETKNKESKLRQIENELEQKRGEMEEIRDQTVVKKTQLVMAEEKLHTAHQDQQVRARRLAKMVEQLGHAEKRLEQLAHQDTSSSELSLSYFEQALGQFDSGDHESSLMSIDKAVKLSPWNASYRFFRGMIYSRQGRRAAATEEFSVGAGLEDQHKSHAVQVHEVLGQLNEAERKLLDSFRLAK